MDKKNVKGLKKIWFKNFIVPLIVINLLICIMAGLFIKDYYYGKVSDNLRIPLLEISKLVDSNFHRAFGKGASDYIVENFKYKNNIAIEIIDRSGNILSSSEIRTAKSKVDSKDYQAALKGNTDYSVYRLKSTGERIMSYSSPLSINEVEYGVVRFKVSMKAVDQLILNRIFLVFLVLIAVVIFSYVVSSLFIKSITDRLKLILNKSSLIAKGVTYEKFQGELKDEIDILSIELDNMGEEIEASQKMKDEFVASISHELKTPLTSIIGWSEYMLMDESSDMKEVKKNLEIIHSESSRLKDMVGRILDFSKYQVGMENYHINDINISSLILNVIEQMSPMIVSRGFSIRENIKRDVIIHSDDNAIRQVLINLIDNSLKHSKGSTISISLRSLRHKIAIMVKDDGLGINRENINQIWNSFYSDSYGDDGFGLGLNISKNIIEGLDGKIKIISGPSRGSKCFIVLDKMIDKD